MFSQAFGVLDWKFVKCTESQIEDLEYGLSSGSSSIFVAPQLSRDNSNCDTPPSSTYTSRQAQYGSAAGRIPNRGLTHYSDPTTSRFPPIRTNTTFSSHECRESVTPSPFPALPSPSPSATSLPAPVSLQAFIPSFETSITRPGALQQRHPPRFYTMRWIFSTSLPGFSPSLVLNIPDTELDVTKKTVFLEVLASMALIPAFKGSYREQWVGCICSWRQKPIGRGI
ncbi:hypothetical protein BDP27DRAFT_1424610 [Rhodocollybia butyracea]|uniref:Uncharacterized protein n=1 Tax=Rhodocollybia butyracea TaxID=206335 RepID=A0A9P5PM05_9AGAR|nr:hypothetical protein BDP27DRAFT_1424610 [Rhodocollybia butyracea]